MIITNLTNPEQVLLFYFSCNDEIIFGIEDINNQKYIFDKSQRQGIKYVNPGEKYFLHYVSNNIIKEKLEKILFVFVLIKSDQIGHDIQIAKEIRSVFHDFYVNPEENAYKIMSIKKENDRKLGNISSSCHETSPLLELLIEDDFRWLYPLSWVSSWLEKTYTSKTKYSDWYPNRHSPFASN